MGQEAEAEKRRKVFPPYQINGQIVSEADANVIVMHCLPAHRGEEISADILDDPNSVIFDQVENKLHLHKALLSFVMGGDFEK